MDLTTLTDNELYELAQRIEREQKNRADNYHAASQYLGEMLISASDNNRAHNRAHNTNQGAY